MPSPKNLLAGVAALAALALPAAASAAQPSLPPPIPVPAGQVQHTVTDVTFQGNYTIPGVVPWHQVTEAWVSATKALAVTRNASGKLIAECATAGDRTSCWSSSDDAIRTFPAGRPDPSWASWQYQGALIQQQIDMGWYRVVGDTTAVGRPAKILQDTHAGPRDADSTVSIVADAATLAPLSRTTTGSNGKQTFTQTETVTTFENVDPASARFSMSPHPGAKVEASSASAHGHKKRRHHRKAATRR